MNSKPPVTKKQSILRKNGVSRTEDPNEDDLDDQVRGNSIVIAQNSASEFKLKYSLINHAYT